MALEKKHAEIYAKLHRFSSKAAMPTTETLDSFTGPDSPPPEPNTAPQENSSVSLLHH